MTVGSTSYHFNLYTNTEKKLRILRKKLINIKYRHLQEKEPTQST